MIEKWILDDECTGCGGCDNICPKSAISMQADQYGFIHPKIEEELCIECGLCEKICPIVNKPSQIRYEVPLVYAAWSKDEDVRFKSTSGGVFTEISKEILNQNGFVSGAQYTDDNMVEHVVINDEIGLNRIRQSKYIQSNIGDTFKKIKDLLRRGELVSFCGAPCQVAGLNNFLGKEYDNLVTIEFICRGMNSPKAYRKWLDEIEEKQSSKAVKVWFKYKENGWNKSPRCTRVDFTDGSYKVFSGQENLFMAGYLGPNLYIRPSCGECQFNGLTRQADITLADFWGVDTRYDDDKGTSLVLINSHKGSEYFSKIKNSIHYQQRELEEVFGGNKCFTQSVVINPNSKKFLKELDDIKFSILVKKYTKISYFRRAVNKLKRILLRD